MEVYLRDRTALLCSSPAPTLLTAGSRMWEPLRCVARTCLSRQSCSFPYGLVVRIAMFRATVESGTICGGERIILSDPFDKVRIRDEQTSESDCVGVLLLDCQGRAVRCVGSSGKQRPAVDRSEEFSIVQRIGVKFVRQTHLGSTSLDQMQVGNIADTKLPDYVVEEFSGLTVVDTSILPERR